MTGIPVKPNLVVLATVAGVSLAVVLIRNWIERKRRWIQVGRVEQLWLFPMKSAKGQSVGKLDCYPVGPKDGWTFDRRLLLVDQTGGQVTCKSETQLVLVSIAFLSEFEVEFSAPNMPNFTLDLKNLVLSNQVVKSKTRLGIEVETYDCGDVVADWFCELFKKPSGTYRLRYHSESLSPRKLNWDPKEGDRFSKDDIGTFVKLSPYMLMSEESVLDLSNKCDQHWDIQRFRPTIVVSGPSAYDEDEWDSVQIGDNVKFKNVRNCTRCIVTAIDPETGIMNDTKEPIQTLRKYRLGNANQREMYQSVPMLGIHLILTQKGLIKVGDPVKVVYV